MTLPLYYPVPPLAIASYDYEDIANGTGYEVYYGAKGDNGEYVVSTVPIYSEEIFSYIQDQSVATSFTKYFNLDFDITFNLPRNIKGDFLANIPMGIAATGSTARGFDYYVIVKAIHYDGSTETILATGTSVSTHEAIQTDVESFSARVHLLKASISSVRHFKKGEILRFTVEGWFRTTEAGASTCHLLLGHDPQNRNGYGEGTDEPASHSEFKLANEESGGGTVTALSTKMEFHVPFVIDI